MGTANDKEEAIRVEDLSFRYPDYPEIQFTPLFEHLNFSLKKGEIGIVLGKPDSGKSTLSRILAGLVPRHTGGKLQGRVTVMDVHVTETEPYESIDQIGIVFQNPEEQIINTRCDGEIAFALESLGLSHTVIERRVTDALTTLKITHLKERNPATLSDGEKKKLLFACLCAIEPEVFILDETFEEIDPPSRRLMLDFLKTRGKTALILTAKLLDVYKRYYNRLFLLSSAGIIENEGREPQGPFLVQSQADGVIPGSWFRREDSDSLHTASSAVQTEPLVETKNLLFQYRTEYDVTSWKMPGNHKRPAPFCLEIESLEFYRGEVFSVIGRNGSGKSTLGKILSGLLTPEKGSIRISLQDSLQEATPRELNSFTAYMFQNPDYQIFLPTIEEELSYGLQMIGLSRNEIREKVGEAAELFNLPGVSIPPTLMGYGARKRLQAAVYYLLNRPLVVLDEADSGVSLKDFLNILSHFSSTECAIVVITHDIELATLVSDRIVLLEDGSISSVAEKAGFENLVTRFIQGSEERDDH